jgi:hypothetical protein
MKKPPKKRPPEPVPDPDRLITGSPVIGTPTLGQVHLLGPTPRKDLVAVDLAVSSLDIAPQFKQPPAPAKGPATKVDVLDEIFSRRDLSREGQRRIAHERYPQITETELREAERKHKRKRGPQPRPSQFDIK